MIDQIIETYRLRQDMVKGMTKLQLQAQAIIRRATGLGKDDNVSSIFKAAMNDPEHEFHYMVLPFAMALEPLESQREMYEKTLIKLVKQLPVYPWVKSVKGFGDLTFACIVGEAGDISRFSGPAKLWKRMGLAVMDGGSRQGNPGKSATAEDWIRHGYSKVRRSVMWNAGNGLILGMGKFRPMFGEDLDKSEYTEYQKLFAERARLEQAKLGKEVTESKIGKESYCAHAANRAKRYVEKRALRDLWVQWNQATA